MVDSPSQEHHDPVIEEAENISVITVLRGIAQVSESQNNSSAMPSHFLCAICLVL
jgi:hypothetical protein